MVLGRKQRHPALKGLGKKMRVVDEKIFYQPWDEIKASLIP